MTVLNKISERVRNGIKGWYDNAGVVQPAGARVAQLDEDKAYENLKLMAGLLAEGTPKSEVAALQLIFANNPDVSIAAVIKVARDKRGDPAISPVLKFFKETLLPPRERETKKDGTYDAAEEKKLEEAEKARIWSLPGSSSTRLGPSPTSFRRRSVRRPTRLMPQSFSRPSSVTRVLSVASSTTMRSSPRASTQRT
jgi:hypothetical protein